MTLISHMLSNLAKLLQVHYSHQDSFLIGTNGIKHLAMTKTSKYLQLFRQKIDRHQHITAVKTAQSSHRHDIIRYTRVLLGGTYLHLYVYSIDIYGLICIDYLTFKVQ